MLRGLYAWLRPLGLLEALRVPAVEVIASYEPKADPLLLRRWHQDRFTGSLSFERVRARSWARSAGLRWCGLL
jgi:hypothetical protein